MKKVTKPDKAKPYDHLEDTMANACSATECTGLIMQPSSLEEELEAYMEVYDFGPPFLEEEKEKTNGRMY